ncbi:MAG TPA: lysylphosphatidylglycerol synthase domain-containing protein [Caulobacteraceae bacterium]|nr:lysylphosphatidylglycerol synthase domain-containing protein [Caulobacteraceae bacterium]
MSAPEQTGRGGHVRRAAVIAAIAGLVIATGIIAYVGFGKVAAAFAMIGWKGLGGMILTYLPPVVLLSGAWWVLDVGARLRDWPVLYYARLVRDASGELLPFSSLGGFVFGARAAILGGVEPAAAISTTAADVTAEFIGQLGFTAVGIALLAQQPGHQENQQLLTSSILGLAAGVVAAILFVFVQRWASAPIERAVARWAPAALAQTSAVIAQLHDCYRKPGRLTISSVLHLGAWLLGAVGVWIGLHFAGIDYVKLDNGQHLPLTLRMIVGLESLVYVVRTITFATPMGLGVIEGGYVLVGHLFGLPADFCLGLSLIKRLRDIAIGVPAIAIWQLMEGRRAIVTPKAKAASPSPTQP